MSVREKRLKIRRRVRLFLSRLRKNTTYGEVAKKTGVKSAMAVGQILRGIVNDNPKDRALTRKVKKAA